jgi:signal peptidase II
MGNDAQGGGVNMTSQSSEDSAPPRSAMAPYLWGPFTRLGLTAALITCVLDQAVKLWLLHIVGLDGQAVTVGPFLDLVLVWNKGISYGLFQQDGALGQWPLLFLKVLVVGLIWIWLARAHSRLTALSLGLLIGGATGNAIDRLAYGAVADFAHFHVTTATWNFSWYVFNLADVAVVVGILGFLYDSLFGVRAAKAPRSGT